MVHFVAGQLFLITTKSVRLGNVAVGEYSTRTIDSEQTWIFNVPVPMEKTTPSASCWNLRTGFIGLHCAAARGVKRALTAIANRKKNCGIRFISSLSPETNCESHVNVYEFVTAKDSMEG